MKVISPEYGVVIPKQEANKKMWKMFTKCCGVWLKHIAIILYRHSVHVHRSNTTSYGCAATHAYCLNKSARESRAKATRVSDLPFKAWWLLSRLTRVGRQSKTQLYL